MKKIILSILALTSIAAHGTVSITDANIVGLTDSTGVPLDPAEQFLVLAVADTGDDSFSLLQSGDLSIGSVIGTDGNDVLLSISETTDLGFGATALGSFSEVETMADDPDSLVTLGDDFTIFFFTSLASTATSLTAGDEFGAIRGSDFVLPLADGNTDVVNAVFGGVFDNATFGTVQAIPEPSSTALLGLGGLALLARRRRL